jgi:hypothetical protein
MRAHHRPLPDYSDTASLPSSLPSPVALDEINEEMLRLRMLSSDSTGSASNGTGVAAPLTDQHHSAVTGNGHGNPSSTGTSAGSFVSGVTNGLHDVVHKMQHRKENECTELLLNPLGAGDTASAVFLMDYIDTRVCFYMIIVIIMNTTNTIIII